MKFFCDIMLGKLAKFLRILGFDTRYERLISEQELILAARREGRIIITRKKRLVNEKDVIFLDTDSPKEQLKILNQRLNLKDRIKPFSRCLICNEEIEEIDKEEAKGKVPYFTFQTQENFSRCPSCQRIYWAGSHLKGMRKFLDSIIK